MNKKNIPLLKTLIQSRNEQLRYLPQSVKMEEAVNPHIINLSMSLISAAVVIFIIWASLTEINEIARAEGEVVPQGFVQVVQHLDGGLVTEILTGEGDMVQEGDVLIRIDDGKTRQDFAESLAHQTSLLLQNERLHALVENRDADFSKWEKNPQISEKQKRIFFSMLEAREKELNVTEDKIKQKEKALETLEKQSTDKNKSANFSQKKNETEIARARSELEEYKNRLSSLQAGYQRDIYAEIGEIEAELKQSFESHRKLEDKVHRLDIRAPVTGIIKGLKLNTIGGIAPPRQTLMEILPIDKNLVVVAKISTADIGHIQIGQSVKVKIRSYDFTRYGAVEGRLDFITATTFQDENNTPYYRGRVFLTQNYVGDRVNGNKILPGMTVEADIVTGRKTILEYLLKPIGRAVQTAMTER